ncbi:MAG: ScyD/ScyE family protein [Thermomicrobiales bacterium]|nr:ScyD/ScyE family protein [Thermomicrobiales bacterium]
MSRSLRSLLLFVLLVTLLAPRALAQESTPGTGVSGAAVTPIAAGLVNPRGVVWAPDGTLYVAQAGTGGTMPGTPVAAPPVGPFHGGLTASVVRIEAGCPVPVAGNLPSVVTAVGEVLGVEDLAILDGQLYASIDGGGEAHGNAAHPAGVYRILADGTAELVADLSAWVRANPVAVLPPDHDPDAAGFSLVADPATGSFWVGDPNSGQLLNVALDGTVTRIVDLSAEHRVPTGLVAAPQGGVYVGFLTPVPYPDGASKVIHVAPDGTVTDVWSGLTAVTDVAVGPDGTLYATEISTGNLQEPPFMAPGSGRIVRQTERDSQEEVASGLMFPVSLAFGPDGALYVSIPGIGADQGQGIIGRIEMGASGATATAEMMPPSCPTMEATAAA